MSTAPFLGSTSPYSRGQLRGRSLRRLSRDVYVPRRAEVDLLARARAAVLALPDGVPCGTTAALLLGLPADDDGQVHLARGRRAPRSERDGVRVHRAPVLPDEQHALPCGLVVADGPRVLVDLGRCLSLEPLVAVADVVLRRWGAAALDAALDRGARRRGIPLVRHAVSLADPGSGSPAETRARLRLHAAGFTALRHGVVVRDAAGGWLAAPDLADEHARVALQHDGAVHFRQGRAQADVQRDESTRQQDWEVVVATARDDRQPHLLVEKVTGAYRRAARWRGPEVLPPHLR